VKYASPIYTFSNPPAKLTLGNWCFVWGKLFGGLNDQRTTQNV
jgi:hypothetical protein